MKNIAIVGTQNFRVMVVLKLAEKYHRRELPPDIRYTIFCSSRISRTKQKEYKGCQLKYIPLHANGIQSIPYDIWSLCQAMRGYYDTILVLGISGCCFFPYFVCLQKTALSHRWTWTSSCQMGYLFAGFCGSRNGGSFCRRCDRRQQGHSGLCIWNLS